MTPSDVDGAELLASEELNRVLSEAMPGGILHVSAEGRVVLANDEAMRILRLRYDPSSRAYHSELPDQSIHEDGSPCPPEEQPIARALRTGQRQADVTTGLRSEDGGWLWTLSTSVPVRGTDGRLIGVVSAFLDVTRQRNAQLALKQSEARLRSVLESVPGYVLLVDRELTILYCSAFVPGVSASQVLGQSALGFVREAERQGFRERILRILATGKPESFEVSADAWIGNATYRLSGGVVREGQDVTGVALIAEDITSQKEMEARLMLSERMASIGTLAAGVAHEINNPLTYVLGNLELLERFLKDGDPELGSRIAEAIEGSERISAVVRDLMSFSHPEDNQRMPVDVSSVIDRALRMAGHEIQRRALLIRGPSDVPEVGGSAARLGQVLLNLLINAAHAIPKGAREQNQVRISAQSISPDQVRITVSDTGRGIERALLGRIFDPFITTKPFGEGTGLGLYVCHSIVTALGGAIWVDSQVAAEPPSTWICRCSAAQPAKARRHLSAPRSTRCSGSDCWWSTTSPASPPSFAMRSCRTRSSRSRVAAMRWLSSTCARSMPCCATW